jgi:conjugal transfer pilus assembly protein TrbC
VQRIPSSEVAAQRDSPAPSRRRAALRTAAIGAAAVAGALLMSCPMSAHPQELERAIRQPWTLYVFVSTGMPHQSLVDLARDAARAHAAMVFRGFPGGAFDLQGEQRLVARLNEECCRAQRSAPTGAGESERLMPASVVPAWSIDPMLYHRFDVTVVPTFVIAATGVADEQSFSKVSGDMALASALKYFAQRSAIPSIRQQAVSLYQLAYGGRQ